MAVSARPPAPSSLSCQGQPPGHGPSPARYLGCSSPPSPSQEEGRGPGSDRRWWFTSKGKGHLSSADAAGTGLRAGRCLADTELTPVASYCCGMPSTQTFRGPRAHFEGAVVAAACEGAGSGPACPWAHVGVPAECAPVLETQNGLCRASREGGTKPSPRWARAQASCLAAPSW